MAIVNCLICQKEFYSKPSHVKRGWGKYCSTNCRSQSQYSGQMRECFICKKKVYKQKRELDRSKSGLFFCRKSCQTIWRNKVLYSGENHSNWKTGINAYRRILSADDRLKRCAFCLIDDERVLIVHHIDHNRDNNNIENLAWLCCNCHFLIHQYKESEQDFLHGLDR